MYTSRPLHFHIVCDEGAIAYLETRLSLLTHPVHPITVRFYRLTLQNMADRVAREGTLSSGHAAGIRTSLLHDPPKTSIAKSKVARFALRIIEI